MNRILFERQSPRYVLDPRDPRFEHVRGVLRLKVGDGFDAGVINGPVGRATITAIEPEALRIEVEWGQIPPPPPPVDLLIGLCRPATVRKILATAPTLGVRTITFFMAQRSDPAYARSALWRDGEWRRHAIEGAEQAFDTRLPEVRLAGGEDALDSRLPPAGLRLAMDVYEGAGPLSAVRFAPDNPVALAIGPERGWGPADRQGLRRHRFQMVSAGTRVMRVETAVVAGLTLVLAGIGRI
jgi:RsmE family RNA methyltransferase